MGAEPMPDTESDRRAEYVRDMGSYDGWLANTKVMRQWLRGDTISTECLVAELRLWLDYWEDPGVHQGDEPGGA